VADLISIDEALIACRTAGNTMVPGVVPVQSELKKEASLIGLAYLNYIYQNDIANRHFCEAMLLMHAQVPQGTANPFVALFTPERALRDRGVAGRRAARFRLRHRSHRPSESESRGLTGGRAAHSRLSLRTQSRARCTCVGF
jgi:hypothetical protein